MQDVEAVFDRELYFYVAPIEDDQSPVTAGPDQDSPQ